MDAQGALKVMRGEYARARLVAQRTRAEALTKPTAQGLLDMDLGWTEEDAALYVAEWNEVDELRDWQRQRDRCSALRLAMTALEAVIAVEAMGRSKFPEFEYQAPRDGDPSEVIADLMAALPPDYDALLTAVAGALDAYGEPERYELHQIGREMAALAAAYERVAKDNQP